ncbi:MAG: BatD family protein [Verrucomicrobia bacterium]|nr:BatD family protein [Cytophagales bacterium]
MMWTKFLKVSILFFGVSFFVEAQEIEVEIPKKNISLNEFFIVALVINQTDNQKLNLSDFPVFKDFQQVGKPTTVTTTFGGSENTTQTLTMRYKARKEGTFKLPAFTMLVNEKETKILAMTVQVNAPKNPDLPSEIEIYEAMLDAEKLNPELADNKEDAFFALTSDKNEVFTGEGFTVTLALYVAENNKADLDAYKQGEQITRIISQLKPKNCWEEDFGIMEYEAVSLLINRKKYNTYTFYRASFFPINSQPVVFPKVSFVMLKYSNNRQKSDFVTFSTEEKKIIIKNLPPHPLREQVSTGNFRLEEEISNNQLKTGNSFRYNFSVVGAGNLSSLNLPKPVSDSIFDFFSPKIGQSISYSGNYISGSKTAYFQIIPKKAGKFALKNKFFWVYFNLQTQQYDTLRSTISINVLGENTQTPLIDPIYADIFKPSTPKNSLSNETVRVWASAFILCLLLATLVFTFVKNKP